jgi:hypothetical protein
MEGCHWPFRKAGGDDIPKLLNLLLTGKPQNAEDTVGWLVDFSGGLDEALSMVWKMASEGEQGPVPLRKVAEKAVDIPLDINLPDSGNPAIESARKAIISCIKESCGSTLTEALAMQAKHSADFMSSESCRRGLIGTTCAKVMNV